VIPVSRFEPATLSSFRLEFVLIIYVCMSVFIYQRRLFKKNKQIQMHKHAVFNRYTGYGRLREDHELLRSAISVLLLRAMSCVRLVQSQKMAISFYREFDEATSEILNRQGSYRRWYVPPSLSGRQPSFEAPLLRAPSQRASCLEDGLDGLRTLGIEPVTFRLLHILNP